MQKLIFILISLVTLTGCSAKIPSQIALSPEAPAVITQQGELPALKIQTIDTRAANFIVRFDREEKAAKLISPAIPPRVQLEKLFNQGFIQSGYSLNSNSSTKLSLQIESLISNVTESSFEHLAEHRIVIKVIADNTERKLTKYYRATGTLKGPLSIDVAAIELALNQLLSELTGNIINDPELNQFLQQK